MNYLALFLSVAAGYVIALIFVRKGFKQLPIVLAFSGSFLLSITLFELLPEVFEMPSKTLGLYIMGGIMLQIILDFFSKGAEHGHVHLDDMTGQFPWLLFISLAIHSLIEGVPIVDNNSVLVGVIIHKIPIAIILTLFFIKTNYSKSITAVFLLLFALMTPLGSFLASEFETIFKFEKEINAVAIGIFLHVSTTILFETSKDHRFNLTKLLAILVGVGIAYFV